MVDLWKVYQFVIVNTLYSNEALRSNLRARIYHELVLVINWKNYSLFYSTVLHVLTFIPVVWDLMWA